MSVISSNDWRTEIEEAMAAFLTVGELAGEPLSPNEVSVELLNAPHRPSSLPPGKMAVYGFWGDGAWLKIGKAGPHSNARYASQNYGLAASSTLAKTLIQAHGLQPIVDFDPEASWLWIRANAHRFNVLLPARRTIDLLALLETFLIVRLKPSYEGFATQRPAPATYSGRRQ